MTLSNPHAVMSRLESIEKALAIIQNGYEEAAFDWFIAKRNRETANSAAFLNATGTEGARKAHAAKASAHIGKEAEASFEKHKAAVRVLETRANIGMAILKAQGKS